MRSMLAQSWQIYRKDMLVEYRTRERVVTMFVFSLIVVIIFNFAFNAGADVLQRVAPGMIWVAFAFAGMLSASRSFSPEKDRGTFEGLLLAPIDTGIHLPGQAAGQRHAHRPGPAGGASPVRPVFQHDNPAVSF